MCAVGVLFRHLHVCVYFIGCIVSVVRRNNYVVGAAHVSHHFANCHVFGLRENHSISILWYIRAQFSIWSVATGTPAIQCIRNASRGVGWIGCGAAGLGPSVADLSHTQFGWWSRRLHIRQYSHVFIVNRQNQWPNDWPHTHRCKRQEDHVNRNLLLNIFFFRNEMKKYF